MDKFESEHEVAAFEEFWSWKDNQGIDGEHEEDWLSWWECFLAGYKYAVLTPAAPDSEGRCTCMVGSQFCGNFDNGKCIA